MIAYCLECDWSGEYDPVTDVCPECGERLRVPDLDELIPDESEDEAC